MYFLLAFSCHIFQSSLRRSVLMVRFRSLMAFFCTLISSFPITFLKRFSFILFLEPWLKFFCLWIAYVSIYFLPLVNMSVLMSVPAVMITIVLLSEIRSCAVSHFAIFTWNCFRTFWWYNRHFCAGFLFFKNFHLYFDGNYIRFVLHIV